MWKSTLRYARGGGGRQGWTIIFSVGPAPDFPNACELTHLGGAGNLGRLCREQEMIARGGGAPAVSNHFFGGSLLLDFLMFPS